MIDRVVWMGCLHDRFPLTCPVCGGMSWDRIGDDLECNHCGVQVHITEDCANCCMVLEVQAA